MNICAIDGFRFAHLTQGPFFPTQMHLTYYIDCFNSERPNEYSNLIFLCLKFYVSIQYQIIPQFVKWPVGFLVFCFRLPHPWYPRIESQPTIIDNINVLLIFFFKVLWIRTPNPSPVNHKEYWERVPDEMKPRAGLAHASIFFNPVRWPPPLHNLN